MTREREPPQIVESPLKFVPKGLRSFDAEDQDFFLELLPGPRRGDGLPESVHFWKVRIEEMDPDKTFRVGYIFGPSGCGKSSLVKAGLLPRLSKPSSPSTSKRPARNRGPTAQRIAEAHPGPPRRSRSSYRLSPRRKIRGVKQDPAVIDQFEQWYHAKGAEKGTELPRLSLSATEEGSRRSSWYGMISRWPCTALWRSSGSDRIKIRTSLSSISSISSTPARC